MTSSIRSGQHLDRLAELEEERRYLLRSLRDLERERDAGDVDEDDYATLSDGYTVRAAAVLRQIEDGRRSLPQKRQRSWKRGIAIAVTAALCAGGIGAALASAFGERGTGQEITGFSPADSTRTVLANARAALSRGDFARANELFVQASNAERERGNDNAEAIAYVGWTFALLVRQSGTIDPDDERLDVALLALDQAIEVEPTYADPYCFAAIINFNFRGDAEAALPYIDACQASNPPSDIAGLVDGFAAEIRAAV